MEHFDVGCKWIRFGWCVGKREADDCGLTVCEVGSRDPLKPSTNDQLFMYKLNVDFCIIFCSNLQPKLDGVPPVWHFF